MCSVPSVAGWMAGGTLTNRRCTGRKRAGVAGDLGSRRGRCEEQVGDQFELGLPPPSRDVPHWGGPMHLLQIFTLHFTAQSSAW